MLDALDDRSHTSHIIGRGKMTRGVFYGRVPIRQFPETRRKVGLVFRARDEINRGYTRRFARRKWNWNSVGGTYFCTEYLVKRRAPPKRYPQTIHFNVLPSRFPLSFNQPTAGPAVISGYIGVRHCKSGRKPPALVLHRTKAHLVWHCEILGFHKAYHVQVRRKYVLHYRRGGWGGWGGVEERRGECRRSLTTYVRAWSEH